MNARTAVTGFFAVLYFACPVGASAARCAPTGVQLQVLGSGGPELVSGRASSSYLVWIGGHARVLVDIGGGAALRLSESGASVSDLDVVLLTHLHADHTADLPALVKAAWFESRTRPLPVYGPLGNRFSPSTVTFVRTLFDPTRGAYRYLGDVLNPMTPESFKVRPHDVRIASRRGAAATDSPVVPVYTSDKLSVTGTNVVHGVFPALAFRVETLGKKIVFSGDMNGENGGLEVLAKSADILVAHNAVPEGAVGVERALHMPPSVIGHIAKRAGVKRLVLSHRMRRTLGKESATLTAIRKVYTGPVTFADDLACFAP